jgi:predicted ArsR family transcriptional regulator
MASSLKQNKMYYKYKIMCMVSTNPNVTYRQIANKIDISTGAAYNLMTSLISQGAIYIENINKKKTRKLHSYKLSNIGIREKAILSRDVLEFKKVQLIQLEAEIRLLELEASSKFESKDN